MGNTGKEDIFYIGVKGVIQNNKGDILLLKTNPEDFHDRTPSFWELPGGRKHQEDTIFETLRREVFEEAGIKEIKILKFLDVIVTDARVPYKETFAGLVLLVYHCRINEPVKVRLSFEHLDYGWFPPKQAYALLKQRFKTTTPKIIKDL